MEQTKKQPQPLKQIPQVLTVEETKLRVLQERYNKCTVLLDLLSQELHIEIKPGTAWLELANAYGQLSKDAFSFLDKPLKDLKVDEMKPGKKLPVK